MARSTVGKIDAISRTHSYKWIISDFCSNCVKTRESLISPNFSLVDKGIKYDWYLQLYPKGNTEKSKDSLSLFLCNMSTTDIIVNATLSILYANNVAKNKLTMENTNIKKKASFGFPKFLDRDYLRTQAKAILHNDALTIICEITIMCTQSNVEDAVKAVRHSQQLQSLSVDLEQMMNQKDFTDISINVGGQTLHAHKSILGKRSRVFAAMFQHNMREKKQSRVDIVDIKLEIFQEMLRYIYCGKVNNIQPIAGELLAAADKYSLEGLTEMCEEILADSLSVEGIFESLRLADKFSAKNLRAKAIEFMALHAHEVVSKPEFRQLPNDVMYAVCYALSMKSKK